MQTPTVSAVNSLGRIYLFHLGMSAKGTQPIIGAIKSAQVNRGDSH